MPIVCTTNTCGVPTVSQVVCASRGLVALLIVGCTMPNPSYAPEWDSDSFSGCVDSLAGVGMGGFSIRFDVVAAPYEGYRPLLNQRAVCDLSQTFWAIGIPADGTILVHTNGSSILTRLYGIRRIDDRISHSVLVHRREGVLSTVIDGQTDVSIFESADLDVLPPLVVGRGDYCYPAEAVDAVVTDVCIIRSLPHEAQAAPLPGDTFESMSCTTRVVRNSHPSLSRAGTG